MSRYSVILDANVLASATVRDVMMRLALTGLFKARWSDDIHDEWVRALVRRGFNPEKLARVRELMDRHVMDAKVTGYHALIEALTLPDPDDRHVLAAAIRANADAIVTFNLKDFPAEAMAPYDIEILHPDEFIQSQIELDPASVCAAIRAMRLAMKQPEITADALLDMLKRSGLPVTASILESFRSLI